MRGNNNNNNYNNVSYDENQRESNKLRHVRLSLIILKVLKQLSKHS